MDNLVDKLKYNIETLKEIRSDSNLCIVTQNEVEVCNEKGSNLRSPECPNCGSWRRHWGKISGLKFPKLCSNTDCCNDAIVGGHVVFSDNKTGRKYIVPLCDSCNGKSSDEIYTIRKGTVMISANCKDTCDKLK